MRARSSSGLHGLSGLHQEGDGAGGRTDARNLGDDSTGAGPDAPGCRCQRTRAGSLRAPGSARRSADLADDGPVRRWHSAASARASTGWSDRGRVRGQAAVRRPRWRVRPRKRARKTHPYQKYIEIAGVRFVENAKKKPEVTLRDGEPLARRARRADRKCDAVGPHAEIRRGCRRNVHVHYQPGAVGDQGSLGAADHQAQDLRTARLAEREHRYSDHCPGSFSEVLPRLVEIRVDLERAAEIRARGFGLSELLQRDPAIVEALGVPRVERQRAAELGERGVGLSLVEKRLADLAPPPPDRSAPARAPCPNSSSARPAGSARAS